MYGYNYKTINSNNHSFYLLKVEGVEAEGVYLFDALDALWDYLYNLKFDFADIDYNPAIAI